MNLLEIRNLTASFGTHPVLHNLSLNIPAGQKTAIVGESGSGKTVLAQSIIRLNPDVSLSGSILFDGTDILRLPEKHLWQYRGKRIGMVFQEPMTALNPVMPIGKQIAEVLTLHLGLTASAAKQRSIELLQETGIQEAENKIHAYPFQLSGGQRQRAMIAMALAAEPELLIADEPTTALDPAIQTQILDLLNRLQQERKMTLLYITHDLNLVRRFADQVIVMKQGNIIETAATQELFAAPKHEYTKQLINAAPKRLAVPLDLNAPEILNVNQLTFSIREKTGWLKKQTRTLLHPVSFSLKRGETLGIIGESGSGKTTLAKSLLRLIPTQGTVQAATTHSGNLRPIQMVFQDPFSAFNPRMNVLDIVTEALRVQQPKLDKTQRTQAAQTILTEVGLPENILHRYPHEFSGGQRQRLAIARAMITRPPILLLDEPTSALDVQWQHQILQLLSRLQREYGLSMILITHDMNIIRAMAHRVMTLQNGKIIQTDNIESPNNSDIQ